MEGSMGDKVLNKFGERAQIWASVSDNEDILNGKVILRARANFLTARREAFNYVQALERTVKEVEQENAALNESMANVLGEVRELKRNAELLKDHLTEARQEIEARNRTREKGPDEIGAEYIIRLGIPELTEVFNRTVLGKNRG